MKIFLVKEKLKMKKNNYYHYSRNSIHNGLYEKKNNK